VIPLPNAGNPVLLGGVWLMLIGSVLAMFRSVPDRAIRYVSARLFVSCAIDNEDSIYHWVALWLAMRPEMQKTGALRVLSSWEVDERTAALVPGDGEHSVRYRGARLWITVSSASPDGGLLSRERPRTIRLRCLMRHRPLLEALLREVVERERNPDPTLTRIFVAGGGPGGWQLHGRRAIRTRESVVLAGHSLDQLVTDAQRFLASRERYAQLGVPYRRGYLFSGPPGNGKSSLALALAAALGAPLYVLSLGDPTMNDGILCGLLGSVPPGAVVVTEDVDTIFNGREREAENKLTMSGLLNAMDGPLAAEGRLLILTTNHPEVLDPALVRPGRVDLHLTLDNATAEQARRMWRRFDGGEGEDAFVRWAGDGAHSMADLQAHLLARRDPNGLRAISARSA
jgi:chaperone BCS1